MNKVLMLLKKRPGVIKTGEIKSGSGIKAPARRKTRVGVIIAACVLMFWRGELPYARAAAADVNNDTMLMFVGEAIDVVSIASRREEGAWQAPAVANVVTRQQFRDAGMNTIGEVLSSLPGFYIGRKEWGSQPYLRGIPNSTLFLLDSVPLGSDVTKSLNFLNNEISLAAIKRIEVIRGPGSVLWGPDAFAGIINAVPMTGKDMHGVETGLIFGEPGDRTGAYVNAGYDAGLWDIFTAVSARNAEPDDRACNVVRFWKTPNTPFLPVERMGRLTPDESNQAEAYLRFAYENWLTVSGRIADNNETYAVEGDDGLFTWAEEKSMPSGFVKLETKKELGLTSALRFMGSYTRLEPEHTVIDNTVLQTEDAAYAEMIYDQSLMAGRGLLTSGVSFRNKEVRNAPVWDGYLYDYLGPDNTSLVPGLSLQDYDSRLWSFFGQYLHKIGPLDFLGGLRYDNHDAYQDNISYNLGVVWAPTGDLVTKLLYGTAYRTPFSRQLIEEEAPDLEQINNISAQISWKYGNGFRVSVCAFRNRIKDHVMEDPYAGISEPNKQEIDGVEFDVKFSPFRVLDLNANLTLMDNRGPEEIYKYNDFSSIRPDGSIERHFVDIVYPYDMGPKRFFNVSAAWRAHERVTVFSRLRYFSDTVLVYPRNEIPRSFSEAWLLDLSLTLRNIFYKGVDGVFTIKNLTDRNYEVPGTYNAMEGDPVTAQIEIRKRW